MGSSGSTRRSAQRLRIAVLGYIVRGPLGGLAWHHLQYVLGLHRLGHDVCFLEDSGDEPACYDPERDVTDGDPTYGLRFAADAFERLGLDRRWAYHDARAARWLGPLGERAPAWATTADLVINLSGVNPLRPWFAAAPVRVFVDTDPVFTQIRHARDPVAMAAAREHTAFLTFGENVAVAAEAGGDAEASAAPPDGLPWQPTRQPMVLTAWPVTPGPREGRFTTVMQWDSYAPLEHGGRTYGMKSASFEQFSDLPRRSVARFELAVGSPTAPRDRLRELGWTVIDPRVPTRDPWTYQRYLRESQAEFGVAKHGYVVSACGWFSERSAAYMASGRPVAVQDTGFGRWLPVGEGVLAFRDGDEALAAVDAIRGRYEDHCRAARALVEAYFDAEKVLEQLIEDAYGSVA